MPIISPFAQNPLVDGRQSPNAMLIRKGLELRLGEAGFATMPELTLKTGRRADLVGLSPKGQIVIIEIKSSVEDFRVDKKWPEYLAFCDEFYFATHADVPLDIFPQDQGLFLADAYGAEMVRPSQAMKLPAPTRRALTLRFARAAALHLSRAVAHNSEMPT